MVGESTRSRSGIPPSAWFRRSRRAGGEEIACALLVSGSVLLLAWLATHTRIYTIDSYVYMTKARSLLAGRGVSVPWNDGVDRKFFWGYSFALALPLRIFGDAGAVVLACAIHAAIGASFCALAKLVESRAAVRVAALGLTVFSPLLLWWGSVPASEPLFTLLVLEATRRTILFRRASSGLAAQRAWTACLCGGLAIATRAEGVLLLPVLAILAAPRLWRDRRFALTVAGLVLLAFPESAHLAYLHAHAEGNHAASEYLEEIAHHARDVTFAPVAWENLRAPFWTVFRLDTEPDTYARFFPRWLVVAQLTLDHAYLWALGLSLVMGLRRRSPAFYAAIAIGAYAVVHALWYYRYERFMTVTAPFAALVFAATAADVKGLIARLDVRLAETSYASAAVWAIVTSAFYGDGVASMHAWRLASRQADRDYSAIARDVDRLDPARRPMMSDLGPYLAYFTRDRRVFLNGEKDFYADAVPWCMDGRDLLDQRHVALVVSKESPATVASRLDLWPPDYDRERGPTTMLSLHLRPRPTIEAPTTAHVFAPPAVLGREVALERVDAAVLRGHACGEVKIGVFARTLRSLAAGDEIFVHAFDAEHTDRHFDVDTVGGSMLPAGDRLEIHFLVRLPSRNEARRIAIGIGLWNQYSGERLALDARGASHDDEDRLRIMLEP